MRASVWSFVPLFFVRGRRRVFCAATVARFRARSASMTGGSRRFRRARSFAASGPIRKQGREIQRYYLFGTLRGEACGERHRRASAGGGVSARAAGYSYVPSRYNRADACFLHSTFRIFDCAPARRWCTKTRNRQVKDKTMSANNLREFIERLEREGELVRVAPRCRPWRRSPNWD